MEEFEKWAASPLWDDEPAKGQYIYPLLIDPKEAKEAGWKLAVGNPPDETYELDCYVCAKSPHSHLGPFRHAIDFLVPDGTPVLAAADGRVVEVQEHSTEWGTTSAFRDKLNYLTIAHPNGEFSQYCHLAPKSVSQGGIAVGSEVKRGQPIAIVGKTGWTDRDH